MLVVILIAVVGVNLAPFVFNKLDLWHAQGMWVQISLAFLFSWSFFEKPRNVPLGLLHLWVALSTAYACYLSQLSGKYNIQNFFPYFNFLCLLIYYQIFVQRLNISKVETIMKYMRWAVIGTMILCVLQKMGVSQFFALLTPKDSLEFRYSNNLMVGILGNGAHLSGFLASCAPLFLWKFNRENLLCLILLFLLLCSCGQSTWDISINGFIVFGVILAIFIFKKSKVWFGVFILTGIVAALIAAKFLPFFLSDNGRFELWAYYWKVIKDFFITGVGLGKVNQVYRLTPFKHTRHLHLEYYQFLLELGFIGLVLIINLIVNFFNKKVAGETQFILKLMVIGFLTSCLFNYPAHLWLTSLWAMTAYAGNMVCKESSIQQ